MNTTMRRTTQAALALLVLAGTASCRDGAADDGSVVDDGDRCGPAAELTEPAAGGESTGGESTGGESITLVAYESFPTDPDNPVVESLASFTAETGIGVDILIAGDTGTMLSKATLTAGNPEGDVMWGIDNTFLSRAIDGCVFEPYAASALSDLPLEFTELVPGREATPVDFGDVCVNYDVAALEAAGVAPPTSWEDLTSAEYSGMLVVQNPATSSPGLAFLMGTIATFGQDGWGDYWSDLVANDVLVVDGWSQAYYEAFSWAGGDRPLVVSYGSSPPFEMLYATEPLDAAPTGVVESTCVRQVEFAGILRGTEHLAASQMLIDYLVSSDFQQQIALNLFVFPVLPDVELDQTFVDFAVIPDSPLSLDPAVIGQQREDWIDEWVRLVQRS